jgi:hypothetical protein
MKSQSIFKQSFTSSSAVLSAVAGEVRRFWLDTFPEGFFKTIRITSGIPSVDDTEDDITRIHEYLKNNPALALRPRMKFHADTVGEYIKNPLPFFYEDFGPDSHLYTLYSNAEYLQSIIFALEYWKTEITIGIRMETEVQLMDVVGYLNNRVFPNNYFYLNSAPVLCEIPSTILFKTAEDLGLNIRYKNELKVFLDILQHNTCMPLDIKIKRDSGQKIIAFMMPANILCRIDEIPEPEVNKNGRSQDNCKIQFNMTAQIPFPKLFKLKTEVLEPSPDGKQHSPELEDKGEFLMNNPIMDDYMGKGSLLINYALTTEPPAFLPGTMSKRIFMEKFITSQNEALDYLEMEKYLPQSVNAFINDMISKKRIDILEESLIFHLYRDEKIVEENNFKFDFKNKKLILFHPFRNYIYRIVLYTETTLLHKYEAALRGISDLEEIFDPDVIK